MSYQPMKMQRHNKHLNRPPNGKSEQGVVIVVALFIVALVATMAYVMISRLERDTRRTTLILRTVQAEHYAQGSIAWAKDQLRNDKEQKKPNRIVDPTPIKSTAIDVNGYKITSTIYDMQSRFNINDISTPDGQTEFAHLVHTAMPSLSEDKLATIINNICDWITPTSEQTNLTKYYLGLAEPYRPAHRKMTNISELLLVKDMTPQLYQALSPFLVAISNSPLAVNIQTATLPVLMTLSPSMTIDAAKMIEEIRKEKPYLSVDAFIENDLFKAYNIQKNRVATESTYFLLETQVTIDKQNIVLYTLLERSEKAEDKSTGVNIVWQSKGL